jgi:hypothetical protein
LYLDSPGRILTRFEQLFTSEIPPGRRCVWRLSWTAFQFPLHHHRSSRSFGLHGFLILAPKDLTWVWSHSCFALFILIKISLHFDTTILEEDPRIPYKGMLGWFGWLLQLDCIIGPCALAYNALTCVTTDQMNQCYTTQDITADNSRDSGGSKTRSSEGCMTVSPNLVKALVVETEHVRTRDWIAVRRPWHAVN